MAETTTAGAVPTTTTRTTSSGGNFLTKKYGPLPVWAYALGGGALLGGIYFLRKKNASKTAAGSAATNTSNLCVDSTGNVAPCNGGCTDANGNAINCTSTDTYTADLITSQYDTLQSQLQAIQNGTSGGSNNTLNVCVDQYGNIVNCGSPNATNSGTVTTSSTGTVTTGSQTVGVTGSGKGTAPTTVVAGGGTTTGGTGSGTGGTKTPPPSSKVPPKMPSGVKGSAVNSTSIKLSWPVVYGATSYEVRVTYQQKLVGSTTVTGTTATVSGLSGNRTYTAHVKACNSAGCSSETNGPVVKTPLR